MPVLVMILVDGKCKWVDGVKDDGSMELSCLLCSTNKAPFYFDATSIEEIHVENFRGRSV